MMQLLLTVMAIGLAALLAVGGINYFSTDIGVRVEMSQALRAQHDAIAGAVSSYRTANNGFVPRSVDTLKGYLPEGKVPEFPKGHKPFLWTIDKSPTGDVRGLCLTRTHGEASRGMLEGVISFAKDRAARFPGTVSYGTSGGSPANDCGMAAGAPVTHDFGLDARTLSANAGATFSFKGF